MYSYWKVERYALNSVTGTHSSTVTDTIDDIYDPIVRMTLGEGKDSFEFKLNNFDSTYDDYFTVGDKFVIYYKVENNE